LIRQKELETKHYLDMQIKMKQSQESQKKHEELFSAKKMLTDVQRFQTEEQKKQERQKQMLREH